MEKMQIIEVVRSAHALAQATDIVDRAKAGRSVSEATAADYAKVAARRLDLRAEDRGDLMEGVSKASWHHHRAALRHEAARLYMGHRRACDAAQKAGDLRKAMGHAQGARRAVEAYQAVTEAEAPAERAPRRTKRKTLPKGDWQRRAWDVATPAMRPALAVGWVGARPAEIQDGVTVRRSFDEGGEVVVVEIPGAKVTKRTGQPWRRITVDPDSDAGRALLEVLGDAHAVEVTRPAKRISKDWTTIRAHAGGNASAYSLRHQFAANLKASKMDPVEIALALGHVSVRSQSRYGSARQGQAGGHGILAVEAARQVVTGPQADAAAALDPFD